MVTVCDKKSFTKKEAQSILNKNRQERGQKGKRGRKEQRMYQCEDCNFWHLTSMDEETFLVVDAQKTVKKEVLETVEEFIESLTAKVNYSLSQRIRECNRRIGYLESELANIKNNRLGVRLKRFWRRVRRFLPISVILLLSSCTSYHYGYGKARITVNGKVHIQELEKIKPLPDTVMEVIMIRRIR